MKFDITQRMAAVDRTIEETSNPLHLAILQNYRRHATLEVCGLWEQILNPDMTIAHPVYRIHAGDKLLIADGMEAVAALYRDMAATESTVIYHTRECIMVSDAGFMTEYLSHRFWRGDKLMTATGKRQLKSDAHYIVTQSLSTFFTYDEDALLTGEIVYLGADMQVTECPESEVISLDECRGRLLPILQPVSGYRRATG
jgi:hypothetical protein